MVVVNGGRRLNGHGVHMQLMQLGHPMIGGWRSHAHGSRHAARQGRHSGGARKFTRSTGFHTEPSSPTYAHAQYRSPASASTSLLNNQPNGYTHSQGAASYNGGYASTSPPMSAGPSHGSKRTKQLQPDRWTLYQQQRCSGWSGRRHASPSRLRSYTVAPGSVAQQLRPQRPISGWRRRSVPRPAGCSCGCARGRVRAAAAVHGQRQSLPLVIGQCAQPQRAWRWWDGRSAWWIRRQRNTRTRHASATAAPSTTAAAAAAALRSPQPVPTVSTLCLNCRSLGSVLLV